MPDGTIVYGEARLDLPGDQRLALAAFLSKFPGFADQSAIEGKLNEVMDRFVGGVTNGDQAYTTDIQPWFDGELAFALGPLPDPGTLSSGGSAAMDGIPVPDARLDQGRGRCDGMVQGRGVARAA